MYRRETKPKIRLITGISGFRCGLDPFRYYDWLLRNLPTEEEKTDVVRLYILPSVVGKDS